MINLKYVKIQYFDFFGYILLTGNGYFFFNSIFSLRSKGVFLVKKMHALVPKFKFWLHPWAKWVLTPTRRSLIRTMVKKRIFFSFFISSWSRWWRCKQLGNSIQGQNFKAAHDTFTWEAPWKLKLIKEKVLLWNETFHECER